MDIEEIKKDGIVKHLTETAIGKCHYISQVADKLADNKLDKFDERTSKIGELLEEVRIIYAELNIIYRPS